MKATWNMPAKLATWNGSSRVVWNGEINAQPMSTQNPIAFKLQDLADAEFKRLLESTRAKYLDHIALFPDLATQAAALLNATTTFGVKLDDVSKADAALGTAVSLKNDYRATAEAVLVSFGTDAAKGQNNNPDTLGLVFPLRKEREKLSVERVLGLAGSFNESPGALDLMWHAQKAAKGFEIWVNLLPNNEAGWALREVSTTSRFTLTGLPSGQKVFIRVRALGTHNTKSAFSDVLEHMVA